MLFVDFLVDVSDTFFEDAGGFHDGVLQQHLDVHEFLLQLGNLRLEYVLVVVEDVRLLFLLVELLELVLLETDKLVD